MLCGKNKKTDRCMQVYNKKDKSNDCEINHTTSQKRCKRKTVKTTPRPRGRPRKTVSKTIHKKKICPEGKELNPKTGRCNIIRPPKRPRGRPRKDKPKSPKPKSPVKPKTPVKPRESSSEYKEIKYRCEKGKIYNHSTGRCVKKDSIMGKKIMTTSVTDTIGGPITMKYYKFEHDGVTRHILFFGDEHTQYKIHNSKNIIQISTLIKKIIRNSPHCIDLFSESPPYENRAKGKALQLYNSPLSAIRNEFGTCPSHNLNRKCKYKNLRYHNWDLRFQRTSAKYLANPYDEVFMNYRSEYNKIIKKFPKKDIVYYLLGFTEKLTKSREKQIDRHFTILLDKYNKRESFMKEVASRDMLDERRKLIRKEYNKCMKSVKFPKDLLEIFVKSYCDSIDVDFTLVFTDFYMICRMFMNFDTNKKTPKLCPTKGKNNFKTPKYIIVYAGDAHNQNVINCLRNLFGEDKFKPEYCTTKQHLNKLIKLNDLYTGTWIRGHGYMKYKEYHNITKVDELFKDFYE